MKENGSLKAKTISGVIWKFGERVSAQAVNFIVSIILARLLLPEDYGLIALVTVFITICNKIVVSGFATSLIQKKDADNLDFSTVFYFSLAVAAILYAGLFFAAPFIAEFYSAESAPELFIQVIRVMGLNLFIIAVNSVQQAYVSRTMQFRKFFFSTIIGTVVSAVAGIALAYMGKGVWALVAQNMILAVVNGIVLWFMVKWRPQLKFSFKRLKTLYSYGWKIFVASLIKILYTDLRSLVIGKVYTAADLAFYNKAQSFPQLIDTNVEGTIDSVLFPAISKKQSNVDDMRAMLRRAIKTTSYILMPLLAGLSAVAKPFIIILLTDKWAESIPLMQILSFSFIFAPVELENLQAIKAIGRSDIALKVEIIKKVAGVLILIASIPFGVTAIAIGMVISTTLSAIINAIPNKKLLGYTFKMQLKDILPSLIMSLVMFGAVYPISLLNINVWLMLVIQVIVGAVIYVALSAIFKVESFRYILSLIKGLLLKKSKKSE
ncbi:MAG: lipopolysaccharide biosynthesis protein [Clostridia bacterium]|nr:lipopolysaccharide biosynthesis protein [Clostridia bacterium]